MPAGRPHWLTAPGATKTPGTVVTLATETCGVMDGGDQVHTLRCWATRTTAGPAGQPAARTTISSAGSTPRELLEVIEAACQPGQETWVLAHNIGFDLAVTMLPDGLRGAGWVAKWVHLSSEATIFRLVKGTRRLVLADTWSWLRCSLPEAQRGSGMRPRPRPVPDASAAAWAAHCAASVRALDRLVWGLLDWWVSLDAGPWRMTSASCGWSTIRCLTPPRTVLVGSQRLTSRLEADAITGGLKTVSRVGEQTSGRFDDWDLKAAYPTVAASLPLPCRGIDPGRLGSAVDPLHPPDGIGTICRVRIQTQMPCAPCRIGGDVFRPVGEFTTTLTSAELPWVLDHAGQVHVLDVAWFELAPWLAGWGRWIIDTQDGRTPGTPPVARMVVKGWGRSALGRFALKTSRLLYERPATCAGWRVETGMDAVTGSTIDIVSWDGVERTWIRDQPGQDTLPAVLAFVEGHVRTAVLQAVARRPVGAVLQVNTDGWWERRPAGPAGRGVPWCPEPFCLVSKATSNVLTVSGPNHTGTPADPRLSGIPPTAVRQPDGSYRWQDWPGLAWQLQVSRPGEYRRPGRHVTLPPHSVHGWVLEDGRVLPPAVMVAADGSNMLRPWGETPGRPVDGVLAAWQIPVLARLAGRCEAVAA